MTSPNSGHTGYAWLCPNSTKPNFESPQNVRRHDSLREKNEDCYIW